jgi:hypothetical protein
MGYTKGGIIARTSNACAGRLEPLGRSCWPMLTSGETAAPERYWCGERRSPIRQAWLRSQTVSHNEADCDLREIGPLSPVGRYQATTLRSLQHMGDSERTRWQWWVLLATVPGVPFQTRHGFNRPPAYPIGARDSAESGLGRAVTATVLTSQSPLA